MPEQLPYVLHTEGLAVLLPHGELLSYYPAHDDTKCCVPCTLHYRMSHGLGLDTSDLARLINPLDDSEQMLEATEARALELQKKAPYGTAAERTACLEVDLTKTDPVHLFGRVTVLVGAVYSRVMETQLFYGHAAWVKRATRKLQPGLRYWLYFEGQQLPLDTREQALEAIRRRAVPEGIVIPEPLPVMSADDYDDLFADIVKKGGEDSKTVRR